MRNARSTAAGASFSGRYVLLAPRRDVVHDERAYERDAPVPHREERKDTTAGEQSVCAEEDAHDEQPRDPVGRSGLELDRHVRRPRDDECAQERDQPPIREKRHKAHAAPHRVTEAEHHERYRPYQPFL